MIEQTVSMERVEEAVNIFGSFDENIKIIEHELSISVVNRDGSLKIAGENGENVIYGVKAIEGLLELSGRGEPINEQNVRYVLQLVKSGQEDKIGEVARDVLCVTAKGKPIILTRPAVEAGERLGFLPGDLQSKVDPYLRPLYDALFDMLGTETYNKYLERGNIEVAPLAYMRGRTLDDSFIILDEAQNTSREQMKMFLTRLGFGSKIVITGDVTQIDLPADKVSGLREAMRVLNGVEDIAICRLSGADVVRHVIVQRIIKAYEEDEHRRKSAEGKRDGR